MSFINSVKSLLRTEPQATVITITSTDDYSEAPVGFFNVETASGTKSLGYKGSFLCWNCGTTVVDGSRRVTLDVPRESLPTVKLDFQRATEGVQHIGGASIIETDALDGDTSTVAWAGTPYRDGVEWS